MKHAPAPTCPRCNSSDDVKNAAHGVSSSSRQLEISPDGFVLDGHCVRPNRPEWYCSVCEESFAGGREFWGNPLTDLLQ